MAVPAAFGYVRSQVSSASPLELVVMLYDGAIGAAETAADAMTRQDLPRRRGAMNKLLAILAELQNTLDLPRGGDLARQLDELYTYMMTRLLTAVSTRDAEPIVEVKGILVTLRDAWMTIARDPQAAGSRR